MPCSRYACQHTHTMFACLHLCFYVAEPWGIKVFNEMRSQCVCKLQEIPSRLQRFCSMILCRHTIKLQRLRLCLQWSHHMSSHTSCASCCLTWVQPQGKSCVRGVLVSRSLLTNLLVALRSSSGSPTRKRVSSGVDPPLQTLSAPAAAIALISISSPCMSPQISKTMHT